jgi:hypothetical protein
MSSLMPYQMLPTAHWTSCIYKSSYQRETSPQQVSNLKFYSDKKNPRSQKGFGDYLAATSMSLFIGANLILFSSPKIAAAAQRWPQHFNNLINHCWLSGVFSETNRKKFTIILQDPVKLAQTIQAKGVNIAKLLQLNTGWQVGLHTQQPSKSLSSILSASVMSYAFLVKYKPIFDCVDNLASFLWFAGESNDIKNNIDPSHRREWDLKRILHPSSISSDDKRWIFSSLVKYISSDCVYAMSFKPWKEFYHALKNKKLTNWKAPQAFQTAIGAQLNLFAFISLFSSYLLNLHTQKITTVLSHISQKMSEKFPFLLQLLRGNGMGQENVLKFSKRFMKVGKYFVAASVIAYVPILVRALQDWRQKENMMTLVGVPLSVTYQVLQASPISLNTHKGLFVIGSPMVNEGKRRNGKRYRSQVNYLKFIYQQAQQNPQLTAKVVLHFLNTNSQERKMMIQAISQNRVDYIEAKLKEAILQQQFYNISLSQFILPMMQEGNA